MSMDELNYLPPAGFLSRKVKQASNSLIGGMIPPQAIEMEQAVLGAILTERNAIDKVEDIIKPDMMYKEAHRLIYEACQALKASKNPIDLLSVKNQLSQSGNLEAAGGVFYLMDVTNKVSSSANIEYHARVIAQKHLARELIKIGNEAVRSGHDETTDVFELYDAIQQQLLGLFVGTTGNMTAMVDDWREGMDKAEKAMKFRQDNGESILTGVPSGLGILDSLTMGFQKQDLIIIGGRPSMGKTTLALNIIVNAAAAGTTVLFFSLEMDKHKIYRNIASIKAGLNPRDVVSGQITTEDLAKYGDSWAKASGIHVDDRAAVNVGYIKRIAKGKIKIGGKFLIVIDYLQLMTGNVKSGGNREQEIASISRGLKELAKDTDTPVIALSQLSRDVEKRTDKRPMMADLRESGAIEQDADVIMFCYRPEYYGLTVYADGSSTHGIGEILVEKQRSGPLGELKFGWDSKRKGWHNLSDWDESDSLKFPKIQPNMIHTGEPRHSEEQPGNEDLFPF